MQDALRQSTSISPKKFAADDMKSKQAAIIDELETKRLKSANRQNRRDVNRKREPGEIGQGTFDDIISGLNF